MEDQYHDLTWEEVRIVVARENKLLRTRGQYDSTAAIREVELLKETLRVKRKA